MKAGKHADAGAGDLHVAVLGSAWALRPRDQDRPRPPWFL